MMTVRVFRLKKNRLKKHSDFYNFYNSEKCVDDFLKHVKCRFKSSNKKWFKCSFNIENTQNSIRSDLAPLLNTRYCTTETYNSTYFNDFILFGLRQNILKREIINNMSGSAWHFKRFTYLALKALDAEVEDFYLKMAAYINFETEADFVEDINEDVGNEVSDFSDIESENSFIDDQDINTDANFYRHFANVEKDIEQVLKDSYDEGLEDIENFDEISNLSKGSEDESEIDNFKNFEVDIEKFKETLFPRVDVEDQKDHNQFSCAILCFAI